MKRDTVSIGEIAVVTSGGTPDRENSAYWGGAIPWVKTTLVQNCQIDACDVDEHITEMGLKSSSAKMIPAGAILMAMVGQGRTRGQVAILNVNATINQNCAAIILKDGIDNRYVYQQFLFRYEEIRNASNSSGQQNLNAGLIREIRIPLPGYSVQRSISKHLLDWDAAIVITERLIAAKETQARAIARKLYKKKAGWSACRLGDFLQEVKEFHGEETYVIGSVGKNGIKPRCEVYSKQLSDNHERNILVEPEWLCFGLANDAIAFGVNFSTTTYSVSPAYKTFEIDGAAPGFIDGYLRVFNARLSKRYLITSARQGKAIDFDGLLGVHCHFPPLHEQHRISAALATMQSEIDTFRSLLAAYKLQKRGLMQKLLTGQWRVKVPEAEVA